MSVSSVSSTTSTTTSDSTDVTTLASQTLDQQDFLELLCVQLENQDPLNPSSDLDSITQLATYASIQQTSELVTSLNAFMTQQNWISAESYLDKWVTVYDDDGNEVTGQVESVSSDSDGYPVLSIDGTQYSVDNITAVYSSDPSADTDSTDSSSS